MENKITIIGAGLAGSLLSIILAKRGFEVEIFEKRKDMRTQKVEAGRSINLALSHRGLKGLERAGIGKEILQEAIPMYGRMLHAINGNLTAVPYGKDASEFINSISRSGLNIALL
ncbi:MAG: kynurenine 3-monooxygenase, partial [Bacteroidetes bacterium]